MQWTDLGRVIAPLLPALGGIVGGFIPVPGAGFALEKLGGLIARQFGVEATPEAVAKAIGATPNDIAIARLKAAADEAAVMWPAIAAIEAAWAAGAAAVAASANETMRAEIRPENRHWFFTGWRPTAGWIFDVYAAVFGAVLMVAGVAAAFLGKRQALAELIAAWPLYAAFFATLAAMVGVVVVARSSDKAKGVDTSGLAPAAAPVPAKPVRR